MKNENVIKVTVVHGASDNGLSHNVEYIEDIEEYADDAGLSLEEWEALSHDDKTEEIAHFAYNIGNSVPESFTWEYISQEQFEEEFNTPEVVRNNNDDLSEKERSDEQYEIEMIAYSLKREIKNLEVGCEYIKSPEGKAQFRMFILQHIEDLAKLTETL
jgi:hypothetical protein